MPEHNQKTFNILYLHETGRISGAEESLLNLARKLDRGTFCPHFILPEEGPLAEELRAMGVMVHKVGLPKIRNVLGVPEALRNIRRIISEEKICLLHSNSIRTHIYAALAGRRHGVSLVWHERNLITRETVDPDRALQFLADKVICNSAAISRRFKKTGKVIVIYNGVDTDRFSPGINPAGLRRDLGISQDDIVVGIASRFNPDKGHETLFRAAEIIRRQSPDLFAKIKFLVAGGTVFEKDKWREAYLRNIAAKLGINSRVVFAGFRRDMPVVYAAMDIFVLASLAEPCGRVLVEAMASGKPVIGTNSGGTPEIVREGVSGYLFSPGDFWALAQKIILLVKKSDLAKGMGQAGRKIAEEKFRIEDNVRKIQEVYFGLINE